ncbi:MAG: transposase [Gammaproteobacteria bacterium]|nr:transposase [Gammaproteobacteria bacterium]
MLSSDASLVEWKDWYYSGAAPHRDVPGVYQFITFRLADSLPQSLLRELRRQARYMPVAQQGGYTRRSIERWLDSGLGCCALSHQELAQTMRDVLLRQDGQRYRLIAWCIMPNHVHVLIEPHYSIARIVQTWKSMTTRWMLLHNDRLGLGVPGRTLWMRDYWDRFIRDERHLNTAIHYIHNNPVKAGLIELPEQWRWSSAYCEGTA